ncbi:CDP-diacylglycerol--serine O-phosphatidyltransferase [Clostridium rectalis]|uniref:CDP-diacylglycerol--serine O-phosphatidyltransferase n=1 Tax=Clostridium rectalis TaxID=2040295 RepID=UPI000F643442|nr:CDP-diacylglycerol--serine O-phosphatidyltransferase [Clostridium rectalis]
MSRFKSSIPNIFTFGNLACGVMSLLMTFEENYMLASIFIICAALADRYDGRVARFLNVSSEIGKELDSLADLVSFGVAPSILIYNMYSLSEKGLLGYLLLLIFPLAGAYRLARYNVTSFDGVFTGIPITIAGMILAVFCLTSTYRLANLSVTLILVVLLSYLMVSKLSFKKV